MIKTEKVEIKINSNTYSWFMSKGYDIPLYIDTRGRTKLFKRGSRIMVLVKDLKPKSNVKILATCNSCNTDRLVSYGEYSPTCWECNLSSQKGIAHPRYLQRVKSGGSDRALDLYLRRRYNITLEKYLALLTEQKHKCAVCGISQSSEGRRFCVDHSHETGIVRGILCQPCNTSLGLLKENRVSLKNMISYLERFE